MTKVQFILSVLLLFSCAVKQPKSDCIPSSTMERDSTHRFALELFRIANKQTTKENFCISPLSAGWAIAMTANGADSNTAKQMYSTLGFPEACKERTAFNCLQQESINKLNNSKREKIIIANSIWANKEIKLKDCFIENNKNFYGATVKSIKFDNTAIKEINSWCSENTAGKIKEIIKEVRPETQLLLINTLYFNAQWTHVFSKAATRKEIFTKADGEKTEVEMMHQSRLATFYEDSIMQATERYFEYGEYSMLLILPREGVSMEKAIEAIEKNYDESFPNGKSCTLQLAMPKFKFEFGTSLKNTLQQMGITDAFTDNANFKNISKKPLRIDDVIQKTYIAVDETGVEAAAATAIQLTGMTARPMEKKTLTLNRPFIYAITENSTGEILFIGKVGNPNN